MRIDSFLARHFRNYTPWRLQRIVAAGQVKIDGNTVEIDERVYHGDVVSVRLIEPPDKMHRPQALPLDIVYEDAWLIVVDKPPGQIVASGRRPADGHAVQRAASTTSIDKRLARSACGRASSIASTG